MPFYDDFSFDDLTAVYYKGAQFVPILFLLLYITLAAWYVVKPRSRTLGINGESEPLVREESPGRVKHGACSFWMEIILLFLLVCASILDLVYEMKDKRSPDENVPHQLYTISAFSNVVLWLCCFAFRAYNWSSDQSSLLLPFIWIIAAGASSVRSASTAKDAIDDFSGLSTRSMIELGLYGLQILLALFNFSYLVLIISFFLFLPLAIVGGVVFGLLYCLTYPCRALCCGKRFTPKGYKPPKVLIVGAGAVGQVYARHLQLGGAQVEFFVRPQHKSDLDQARTGGGLVLYHLNQKQCCDQHKPIRFTKFAVRTSTEEVHRSAQNTPYDQIWLCVPSPSLRDLSLHELLRMNIMLQTTVVCMTPGVGDRDYIINGVGVGEDRLVFGLINMISYKAPLDKVNLAQQQLQGNESGIAYFIPPLSSQPFCGMLERRVEQVAHALESGGLHAEISADKVNAAQVLGPFLTLFMIALEAGDPAWSFSGIRAPSSLIELACNGSAEAVNIISTHRQKASLPPLPCGLRFARYMFFRPLLIQLATYFAPSFLPLPLEPYLEYHFSKVGEQMREFLAEYISLGRKYRCSIHSLQQLSDEFYRITLHDPPRTISSALSNHVSPSASVTKDHLSSHPDDYVLNRISPSNASSASSGNRTYSPRNIGASNFSPVNSSYSSSSSNANQLISPRTRGSARGVHEDDAYENKFSPPPKSAAPVRNSISNTSISTTSSSDRPTIRSTPANPNSSSSTGRTSTSHYSSSNNYSSAASNSNYSSGSLRRQKK